MRVPVAWLHEHLDVKPPAEELAELLTMAGTEAEVVAPFSGRSGWQTPIIETYITPNRGDLLSVVGVAREAAALVPCRRVTATVPDAPVTDAPAQFAVELEAPDLCPRYVGLLVRGVTVGESPAWLADRVEAGGIRSINNVVDVTNLVLLELGQPLHAFDLAELIGPQIIVRRAYPGETITAIDHTERALGPNMLVIADAGGAVAVAGVMGGLRSEISEATSDVLIESAYFSPASIRYTARELGMATEASFRFERNVDPGGCARAARRAAYLMVEVAGGEIAWPLVDALAAPIIEREVLLRPERCSALVGRAFSTEEMVEALRRLEIPAKAGRDGVVTATVPTWRADLTREVDLIEEVARVVGYDTIPERLPVAVAMVGGVSPEGARLDRLREALARCGLLEMQTGSICGAAELDRLRVPEDDPRRAVLAMVNPLSSDLSVMRTELLSSLIRVVERNQKRRVMDVHGFEIGRTYRPSKDGTPVESKSLGIAMTGTNMTSLWNTPPATVTTDFFRLKAAVETAVRALAGAMPEFVAADHAPFDPGCCAEVRLRGTPLGWAGRLDDGVADAFEVSGDVYLAELDLAPLTAKDPERTVHRPLPRYPEVLRDIALVVPVEVPCALVSQTIADAGGAVLERVALFDLYEGQGLPDGTRSLAFSLAFRHPDRTLTNEEVDRAFSAIVEAAELKVGARLRT